MKKTAFFVLVFAVFLIFSTNSFAEDKTIEAEGVSSISKEDAIRQAQRSAVEEAVGIFIQSQTEVENFELKKDKIFSRTQGYITRFSVVKESKSGDLYKILIKATVSLDKIKDDLIAMKILLASMEHPKLMVLIEEDYKSMDNLGMGIAATEMASLLGAKGFELVDKSQVDAIMNNNQARQALAGNAKAAKALGLKFGAQYVVVGKVVAQDAGEAYPGSGLKSIQASLQLKVIQTQTGLVLGSVVKTGVSAHISPLTGATTAIQMCTQKAVDEYLINAITNSFQDYLNNGTPLKLHITGVGSFQKSRMVIEVIEKVERVASSKKEGWNKTGGILELSLLYKGTSEELAEVIDGKKVGAGKLEVIDVAPERLDCILK
ncbi:hypothetical protein [Desulfobacterium sp. N47]|uniref:Flagellar assembly protein T N-terminal domain-containing protein n=1 Tax=uncultured Desulfobacterium sp. TaxID=201089 RepID=E1Y9T3_9BACT|nr:hypothetical protein N47_H21490 [uncultured Desulfobacterium sp.]